MLDRDWLQETFNQHSFAAPGTPGAVRTIMMVGAEPYHGLLGPWDREFLDRTFRVLQNLGLPVAADYSVDVVNMGADHGNEDFLSPEFKRKSDVLVICDILRKDGISARSYEIWSAIASTIRHSAHDSGIDAWHNAALRTEAKVIIPCGGKSEVHARDFMKPEFIEINDQRIGTGIIVRAGYPGALQPA